MEGGGGVRYAPWGVAPVVLEITDDATVSLGAYVDGGRGVLYALVVEGAVGIRLAGALARETAAALGTLEGGAVLGA